MFRMPGKDDTVRFWSSALHLLREVGYATPCHLQAHSLSLCRLGRYSSPSLVPLWPSSGCPGLIPDIVRNPCVTTLLKHRCQGKELTAGSKVTFRPDMDSSAGHGDVLVGFAAHVERVPGDVRVPIGPSLWISERSTTRLPYGCRITAARAWVSGPPVPAPKCRFPWRCGHAV